MFIFLPVKPLLKLLITYCRLFLVSLLVFSCQREINFDVDASSGQLLCLPEVSGTYTIEKDLTADNYVDIQVRVLMTGNYNISTDTKNGFSFLGEGKFTDTGIVNVKLAGEGKPVDTGDYQFAINYNGSTCNFTVNVSIPEVGDAVYTLINTPNECILDTIAGYFVKGVTIDSAVSKIFIDVDVSKAGAYSITTSAVNGYSFTGNGIFEAGGNQVIVLNGEGTPSTSGKDVFYVSTGTSSCSFTIDVLNVVAVTSDDYFPLTRGSSWSYEDLTARGDTMMRTIIDTSNVNGIQYSLMEERKRGSPRTYKFRQSRGGEYFEYASVDEYTGSLAYVPAVTDEIYFMNQVLFKGTTWESKEYQGAVSGGQEILLKYVYTCLEKNTTVVLNGKAFTNVYIINVQPEIRALDYAYNSTGEDYYYYYAKGIGVIYMITFDYGIRQFEWRIKNWDVK